MIKNLDLKEVTALHVAEIQEAAIQVINSGWYLQGTVNTRFEENYSKYIGTKYTVGCANGLDALILIYRAYIEMGLIKPGDEVIVPANTYIASILAITDNNLVPVFVEPKFDTLEIDDTKIEAAITERTKSIMIVHLYGRMAYTERIGEICKKYNLKLVEDNAQAHGCIFNGHRTGSLGDAAAHSFYPTKNLGALGDAGAMTTDDEELAVIFRILANYGSNKKYVFKYKGKNSRLDEIHAAVLDIKLKYLDEDNQHRKDIAKYYNENIKHSLIKRPVVLPEEQNVYHIYPVLCETRDILQQYLINNGVQTVIHYPIPPHKQECFRDMNEDFYPITEIIHNQELSLPMGPAISMEEVAKVVRILNSYNA